MPGSGVRETTLENFYALNNSTRATRSKVWVASPSTELKARLAGKESTAQRTFRTKYQGRPYNNGMINKGRRGRLQCGEFVTEFIKDVSGKNVAPLRGLPFHEAWQREKRVAGMPEKVMINGQPVLDTENFGPKKRGDYNYTSVGNGPYKTKPPYPKGVAPSDPVAREHYHVKYMIDMRNKKN